MKKNQIWIAGMMTASVLLMAACGSAGTANTTVAGTAAGTEAVSKAADAAATTG